MALRAGYYGVKRWLWDKLQSVPGKVDDLIDSNNITGVINFLPITLSKLKSLNTGGIWADNVYTRNNVAFTVHDNADGLVEKITVGGGSASADTALILMKSGEYAPFPDDMILAGCLAGGSTSTYYIRIDDSTAANYTDYGNGVILNKGKSYGYCRITVRSGKTVSGDFYPIIKLANQISISYEPYAMTNQKLTGEVLTLKTVDDEHKTTINAIITAATGAADFAAFKTAMAALTPLTRSAAPDERSLDVEVEEPVVVKKTTRKKTTKTEEEE